MTTEQDKRDHKRLYSIWRGMIRRCEDRNCKDWVHYAKELHVTVCPEWHDFEVFKQWALTHGYKDGLTIDRVANTRGYRPNNCRFVTRKHQAQNRSTCIRVNINGETKTLSEWSRIYGVRKDRVTRRIQAGWDPVKAITTPVKDSKKKED